MNSSSQAFVSGAKSALPLQLGVIPFGLVHATLAVSVGFPWWLALLISIVVFGGSSQLVFIELLTYLSSPFQAVLGANIVNARHLIYSAGVSRAYANFSRTWQVVLGYMLTDQLFAITERHKEEVTRLPLPRQPWFYLGAGLCTWAAWIISNVLGIAFGQLIPKSWNLAFSIPLMFMPLVFATSKSKFGYVSALLAVVLVWLLHWLPFGLGVFFAIIGASVFGYGIQCVIEKPHLTRRRPDEKRGEK